MLPCARAVPVAQHGPPVKPSLGSAMVDCVGGCIGSIPRLFTALHALCSLTRARVEQRETVKRRMRMEEGRGSCVEEQMYVCR